MAENKSIIDVVVELGYMTREAAEKALDARAMTYGGLTDTPAAG